MTKQPKRPESDPTQSTPVMLTVTGGGVEDLASSREQFAVFRKMLGGIGLEPTVVRVRNYETWRPGYEYTDMSGFAVEEVLNLHRNIFDSPEANERDDEEYEALSGPFINGLCLLAYQTPAKAIEVFESLTGDDSSPAQRYIAAITIDTLPVADPTAALRIWDRLLRDPMTEPEEPHKYAEYSISNGLENGTLSAWQALYLRSVHDQAHPKAYV